MTRVLPSSHARIVAVITPADGLRVPGAGGSTRVASARAEQIQPGLAGALSSCLNLLRAKPERFPRAAVVWHARWCTLIPTLTLAEAQTALAGLEAMQGPDAIEGAEVLRRLCARHGFPDVVAVLDGWIAQREREPGAWPCRIGSTARPKIT